MSLLDTFITDALTNPLPVGGTPAASRRAVYIAIRNDGEKGAGFRTLAVTVFSEVKTESGSTIEWSADFATWRPLVNLPAGTNKINLPRPAEKFFLRGLTFE